MDKQISLEEQKRNYIDDLRFKLWEAELNLGGIRRILPTMQETRERIQSQIDICQKAIEEFQKDPTREAREKRQREEEALKKLNAKMADQNLQIYGGEKDQNGKIMHIEGAIERGNALEETINNLKIFIEEAQKLK